MKAKVFFNFNVAFPKGRISAKKGDVQIDVPKGITKAEMLVDNELKYAIASYIQPQFKTGKIISLDVIKVE